MEELAIFSHDVHAFWFDKLDCDGHWDKKTSSKWFRKDPLFDKKIKERFGAYLERHFIIEELSFDTPKQLLALIILFDQFPRNMYRGRKEAFKWDKIAIALAKKGIEMGMDKQLLPIERFFFYLPFMHSEDLDQQNEAIRLYETLVKDAPKDQRTFFEGSLDYTHKHQVIIKRFSRFPHRNAALERVSSDEETTFLKEPGSSF